MFILLFIYFLFNHIQRVAMSRLFVSFNPFNINHSKALGGQLIYRMRHPGHDWLVGH